MSRAFKPMPVVLELVYKNFNKYKNIIFFMGKSGKKIFENSKKKWKLDYLEKKSLTSGDSFLINIKKIEKKN
jgi:16S rRNA (guanine527-N7)-methyltransferase